MDILDHILNKNSSTPALKTMAQNVKDKINKDGMFPTVKLTTVNRYDKKYTTNDNSDGKPEQTYFTPSVTNNNQFYSNGGHSHIVQRHQHYYGDDSLEIASSKGDVKENNDYNDDSGADYDDHDQGNDLIFLC